MAIQGSNTELPLPDLLTTLRSQHGRIIFSDMGPVANIDLFLAPSVICGMFCSGQCILDENVVLEKLIAITVSQRGRFCFEPLPAEIINPRLRISIDGANLTVATMADEIAWRQSDFVHPATMVILDLPARQFEDGAIASFFARAYDHFEIGIDAQHLALKMHISLIQAQFYILKMIEARAVKVGMPPSGRPGQPSPIFVRSSNIQVFTTRRLRRRVDCAQASR